MPKQIKTKARVKNYGEVFTAEREVKAMCDLIPLETWQNIESTFLEPCCGNGAFLKEIFTRKLQYCKNAVDGLKALNSIFGIDIQPDNVEESRDLLFDMFQKEYPKEPMKVYVAAEIILEQRIVCGDSLEIMAKWESQMDFKPTQISFL